MNHFHSKYRLKFVTSFRPNSQLPSAPNPCQTPSCCSRSPKFHDHKILHSGFRVWVKVSDLRGGKFCVLISLLATGFSIKLIPLLRLNEGQNDSTHPSIVNEGQNDLDRFTLLDSKFARCKNKGIKSEMNTQLFKIPITWIHHSKAI